MEVNGADVRTEVCCVMCVVNKRTPMIGFQINFFGFGIFSPVGIELGYVCVRYVMQPVSIGI